MDSGRCHINYDEIRLTICVTAWYLEIHSRNINVKNIPYQEVVTYI
jgi:hypothetical protein